MAEQRITKVTLNTKGVEAAQASAFQPCLVPDGPYLLEITDAWFTPAGTVRPNGSTVENNNITVRFSIAEDPVHEGEYAGLECEDFFSPVPPGPDDKEFPLQRFIALMDAVGLENPNGKFTLELSEMVGLQCWSQLKRRKQDAKTVGDRTYEERWLSRPSRYDPMEPSDGAADDDDEEEEEERKPAKAKAKATKAAKQPEPKEEEDDDEEDGDDEEEEEEPQPVSRRRATAAPAPARNGRHAAPARTAAPAGRRSRVAVETDDDEEEDDEE